MHVNKENASQSKLSPHIYSFFSGAGFLDLGFENAGFKIAYVNEVHKPFLEAYKHSRRILNTPEPLYGYFEDDINKCLTGSESSRLSGFIKQSKESKALIGFIGGPPCPDFSVGGKNRGRDGENGKLSQSYVDLICKFRPDFFVFENVKGLLRTTRHREFFEHLKHQLHETGYKCTERLINSIEYGAPQDRERIILVGFLNNKLTNGLSDFDWIKNTKYPDRIAFAQDWPETNNPEPIRVLPAGVIKELSIQHWFEKNDVENHPNANHQFVPRAGLEKFKTIHEGDVSKKSYKRLHRWRYSPTAAYGNNEVHIHPYLPRRISVSEALAIQSLPKEFQLPPQMTLSNMFKTIGNGVPYLAAKGLAETVMDFLEKTKK